MIPRDDTPPADPLTGPSPSTAAAAAPAAVPAGLSIPPPTPWAGWPTDWPTSWSQTGTAYLESLTDVAWMCLDKNTSILAAMPPYLVGAAASLDTSWLVNPDPQFYNSWEEFARQLFWDFQGCGEAIVIITARYVSGWPARFHLLPPWQVDIQFDGPDRVYSIGGEDFTDDIVHLRYQSRVTDRHGRGPLEVGRSRLVAANLLNRYTDNLFASGGIPTTALTVPGDLTAEQSAKLQEQWINARMNTMGLPAVLSGGVDFRQLVMSPTDLALVDVQAVTETRIANLLGVPGYMVGLPQSSDSLVYNTAALTLEYHWRTCLRPLVRRVMGPLSYRLLPAGTNLELNRDDYIRPGPVEQAQYYSTMHGIEDETGRAMTIDEIRTKERFDTAAPTETLPSGMLQ